MASISLARVQPQVGDIIYNAHRPDIEYEVEAVDTYAQCFVLEEVDSRKSAIVTFSTWDEEFDGWYIVESEPVEADRKQIGGDHYKKHKIQPWDIIDAYGLDFYEGNAVKYLLRYKDKNGVEDLKKAIHYIERIIERAQKNV